MLTMVEGCVEIMESFKGVNRAWFVEGIKIIGGKWSEHLILV